MLKYEVQGNHRAMAEHNPANILLIERDAETRSGIERFFKMSGYSVTAVAGEMDAVQAARADRQDLIVYNTYTAPPESFALAYQLHQRSELSKIPMVITSVHDRAFSQVSDPESDNFAVAYITEVSRLDELEHLIKCIQSFKN